MGDSQSKAAPTEAPERKDAPAPADQNRGGADGGDGAGVSAGRSARSGQVMAAGSGGQTADEAKAERERLAQTAYGPGSGTRLVTEDGESIEDLSKLHDDGVETLVTVGEDVYEEFPAPGAPNRKIKRLLFHKGQQVPKSVIERHKKALADNKDQVEHLESLGRGTGHPKDVDLADDGEGETKERGASRGTAKEGARGSVPRRS